MEPVDKIVIPQEVKNEVSGVPEKSSERDRVTFLFNVLQHYLTTAEYLYKKCLSEVSSLKPLRFIRPENVKAHPEFIKYVKTPQVD